MSVPTALAEGDPKKNASIKKEAAALANKAKAGLKKAAIKLTTLRKNEKTAADKLKYFQKVADMETDKKKKANIIK